MFSNTAEYALRAVVFLATRTGSMCSSQDIAAATRVPPDYMLKVLKDLTRAGLVRAQRGPGGGFELTRKPAEISVLSVVNAADPLKRIETCPLGIPSHGKNLCRLHRKLDDAIALVEKTLRDTPITEMVTPTPEKTACVFPTVEGRGLRRTTARRRA